MIDLQRLNIRQMQEDDPPALALAFADMNKTQGQYERYWQENIEGRRVTIIAVLDGEVVEVHKRNLGTGLRKHFVSGGFPRSTFFCITISCT